jgi:UDPglucose 6-dehydrogenase
MSHPRALCVVGAGHVGLVHAAGMAELGHRVACIDTDSERVAMLQRGQLPIFEDGLNDLVKRHLDRGVLTFTTSYADALDGAEFAFIAVSTPSTPDGAADVSAVRSAVRSVAAAAAEHRPIIVNKSTVPVGTSVAVDHILTATNGHGPFHVVSNPEFLREGTAVHDFFHPDRIIVGAFDSASAEAVADLYVALNAPVLVTDPKTAEMIKYASNAFLATKVSFINEIAEICAAVGADATTVATGMGLDPRIGPLYLQHGLGFGGSCLPKDVRALAYMGSVYGTHPQLLNAVLQINAAQRRRILRAVRTALHGLDGTSICILGLAFKPNTDDTRDAPALDLIRLLLNEGASVRAYDPRANASMAAAFPAATYCDDPYDAARGCDAVIVATEWEEFRSLNLARLRSVVARPVFVDGRNIFNRAMLSEAGFVPIDTAEVRMPPPPHDAALAKAAR